MFDLRLYDLANLKTREQLKVIQKEQDFHSASQQRTPRMTLRQSCAQLGDWLIDSSQWLKAHRCGSLAANGLSQPDKLVR